MDSDEVATYTLSPNNDARTSANSDGQLEQNKKRGYTRSLP
jgi:hypothetical protein